MIIECLSSRTHRKEASASRRGMAALDPIEEEIRKCVRDSSVCNPRMDTVYALLTSLRHN
jgi:hypothetical protein